MKIKTECSFCFAEIVRNESKTGTYFCTTEHKGAWQKLQRESLGFTKEWLASQYLEQGKSANQIGREIGRDSKRVWEWIRDYGLDTRPRGTDYGQQFKKGQESAFKGKNHTDANRAKFRQFRLDDGRMPYMKDGKHWLHHEGAISPSWQGGVTPERQALYSSDAWAEAVKKVWKRDQATCQNCGKHHDTMRSRGTFHIHHIVSFRVKRLRAELDNLILLCRECHLWVHSKQNTERRFIQEP